MMHPFLAVQTEERGQQRVTGVSRPREACLGYRVMRGGGRVVTVMEGDTGSFKGTAEPFPVFLQAEGRGFLSLPSAAPPLSEGVLGTTPRVLALGCCLLLTTWEPLVLTLSLFLFKTAKPRSPGQFGL